MSDDHFAFQVDRLTQRHRDRHVPSTVAEVTLQQWLVMRHRYHDPFDPELFDHVDTALQRMPPSVDPGDERLSRPNPSADGTASARDRRSGRLTARSA